MKLTIKKFADDKRVDVCDDFDNVLYRTWYPDEKTFDWVTMPVVEAWTFGFREGWSKAKAGISDCTIDGRILKFNEKGQRDGR